MKYTAKLWIILLAVVTSVQALHFYLDADEKRCFVEELPADTVVEGADMTLPYFPWYYELTFVPVTLRALPSTRMGGNKSSI